MNLRTRFYRTFFYWTAPAPTQDALQRTGLIVTMSWRKNRDGTPGPGNLILAQVATAWSLCFEHKPVFPTEEVSSSMPTEIPRAGIVSGAEDTFDAARIQAEYCHEHEIRSVMVVAHPLHMNRVIWTFERLGIRALPALMPTDYALYQGSDLKHFTARHHWFAFWLREAFLARPVYLLQGKI